MVVVSRYTVPKGYNAITFYPFIILKSTILKADLVLINHERIHLRQQLELLVLPFYLFYVLEFLYRFIQYKNWYKAYRFISFEREAYTNENCNEYLSQRPFWNFLKYLRHHED